MSALPAAPVVPIASRPHRPARRRPMLVWLLASLLVALSVATFAFPGQALASSTMAARCSGVALRTSASTASTLRVRLASGARVTVVATVSGGRWRTACAGSTSSGYRWYRISAIGSRSVRSLYGVPYLYGATSLFKTVTVSATLWTSCSGTNLRTSASSTATIKARLAKGAKVVVYGTTGGGRWSVTCPRSTSGTSWWRVTTINGRSVRSLYGVTYLYASTALLTTTAPTVAVAPTPTPKPTPAPTPTPTPAPAAAPSPTPTPTPDPYVQGIDVSKWQTISSWSSVAASGKQFAFIKATEGGSYQDPMYATFRAGALAAGLKVGAYHFARPDLTIPYYGDPVKAGYAEADNFINTAGLTVGNLLPVLDFESYGTSNTPPVTTAQRLAWVQAFQDEVYYRTGLEILIYCSPANWTNLMGNSAAAAAAGARLWVAHWTAATTPWVPANNWNGQGWTFWQYTSSGTVPGISGSVDLDRFNSTAAKGDFSAVSIKAIAPQPTPTPSPTPTPAPTPAPTPSPTPAPTPSPAPTPTPSPSPTASPSGSASTAP